MGATGRVGREQRTRGISIHAPVWERPCSRAAVNRSTYFNPRSRMGATYISGYAGRLDLFQSTLPYGSDRIATGITRPTDHFNPRSRMGATCTSSALLTSGEQFQSTLPYGSDEFYRCQILSSSIFQSTLPYGSDWDRNDRGGWDEFQSTLPYGSDRGDMPVISINAHFNPRSRMGATCRRCAVAR